jgi:enoyl-[acyl-carrier protein] reductase III
MYPELNGKVALVTGASRGFGRAIALRLAAEGVKVVINVRRSLSEAQSVADEIAALGGDSLVVRADVGDESKISNMFDQINARFGRLDLLIANASFGIPGPLMSAKSKYWDITLDSTAKSLLLLAQHAVPMMSGWGRIVSVTSYGGQRVLDGYGVVGIAKGAVESLTRALAVELAPEGILVNGVMPGLSDTKSFRAIPGSEESLQRVVKETPIGRSVVPEEVANVVAFLCSNQANMIVGQFVVVDGGKFIT